MSRRRRRAANLRLHSSHGQPYYSGVTIARGPRVQYRSNYTMRRRRSFNYVDPRAKLSRPHSRAPFFAGVGWNPWTPQVYVNQNLSRSAPRLPRLYGTSHRPARRTQALVWLGASTLARANVCQARSIRRQVIFSLGRGGTRVRKPVFSRVSKVSCP